MPFNLKDIVDQYDAHVAPLSFIKTTASQYFPQSQSTPSTDLSVLIAEKKYRPRTKTSSDCSYLISSKGIEFIGKRKKTIEAPYGCFFKVKLSENDKEEISAFKTCSIFLQHLMRLSQDIDDLNDKDVLLNKYHIETLFEYLKIPITTDIKIKITGFFENLYKKKSALTLLNHIPLKNLQDFFNNPITPPLPQKYIYFISYLLDLKREYNILKRLNRLHGAFLYRGKKGEPKFAITMLNIEGMDFYSFEYNEKDWIKKLRWDTKISIFQKTLSAYKEWCTNGIINHGDIKPENILFSKDQIHLIDGNFSYTEEDLEQNNINRGSIHGTPAYMAPELFSVIPHSASTEDIRKRLKTADIYALGTFMIRLMVIHDSQYPEPIQNDRMNSFEKQQLYYRYIVEILQKMPTASLIPEPRLQTQQERVYLFLSKMISTHPEARPSIEEAIFFFEALQAEPNIACAPIRFTPSALQFQSNDSKEYDIFKKIEFADTSFEKVTCTLL